MPAEGARCDKVPNKPASCTATTRVMMVNFNDASSTVTRDASAAAPRVTRLLTTNIGTLYETPTINSVITCENRRKEIANLSSRPDNGSLRGTF